MPGNESKLTLAQAAKLTPGRPHASTLFRWATKGHRGVRLQVWNYGRRLFTTLEAVEAFARAAAKAPSTQSHHSAPGRRHTARSADVAKALHEVRRRQIAR